MDTFNESKIRVDFGFAIKSFRNSKKPKYSQKQLCDKINSLFDEPISKSCLLYQEKLSRIERGDEKIILPLQTIDAIKNTCNLDESIISPFVELMKNYQQAFPASEPLLNLKRNSQLIVNPNNEEIKKYKGKYYCYFKSTDSQVNDIVCGEMRIGDNSEASNICSVEMTIMSKEKLALKKYKGQFIINMHYRAWYCILFGIKYEEVCFLMASHGNQTLSQNAYNTALALTTSAGMNKLPTVHRMLLTRKELDDVTLDIIKAQLKLNSDYISISESKLNELQNLLNNKIENAPSIYKERYMVTLECIEYIRKNAIAEKYYKINEATIYDNNMIDGDRASKAFAISYMRGSVETAYYNKTSRTLDDICMNIIDSFQ